MSGQDPWGPSLPGARLAELRLVGGREPDEVRRDLVAEGFDDVEAAAAVEQAMARIAARRTSGDGRCP